MKVFIYDNLDSFYIHLTIKYGRFKYKRYKFEKLSITLIELEHLIKIVYMN